MRSARAGGLGAAVADGGGIPIPLPADPPQGKRPGVDPLRAAVTYL